MLKYFPIENDVIKEMGQGNILPFLLLNNQYKISEEKNI